VRKINKTKKTQFDKIKVCEIKQLLSHIEVNLALTRASTLKSNIKMLQQNNLQSIMQNTLFSTIVIVTLFYLVQITNGAAAHSGREREADGAFSPRDKHHGDGDKHNSKFDHEAILGSEKEVEEFEHLSPEVAKERLRKLSAKMDRNMDGKIEKKELQHWILRSFRMLSQEESTERFEDNNEDGDDFVTWDEYKAHEFEDLEGLEEGGITDSSKLEDLSMMEEDKVLFFAADVNKDGKLDRKEYVAFSHPEDHPHIMRTPVIQSVMKSKDADHDGKLDFQEFIGDRGKDQDKDWLVSEKERFDTDLDENKDGILDDNEVYAWLVPDNEDVAKEEADHLFAGTDDDHDDFLSFDEIEAHHDIFTGSEATDFGEHLTSHQMERFEDEL